MAVSAPSFTITWSAFKQLTVVGTIGMASVLGGCVTDRGSDDVTGSIASPAPQSDGDLRSAAQTWGERYRANPSDKTAALRFAQALHGLTQYKQAAAVLEDAAIKSPYDKELLAAYGKALADAGRFKEAAEVLPRAHSPDNPNWSVLSAQGSVADQLGDHAEAQSYYNAALKIRPGNPGVLSNLGLSYALSSNLPLAEQTIRQASMAPGADMRVRQNLALVLALEGKFGEAEQVAQIDLSPSDAAASVAAIRGMIAQSDTWRDIQRGSSKMPVRTSSRPVRLSVAQDAVSSAN